MHCEIGVTQGPLRYVSALGATRLVHWLILVAPSCLRSHNVRYIMLKSLIQSWNFKIPQLTHWGWVTQICIGKLTIIGSDNGLSPGWHQAIIWTNAGIFLIEPLGTNFSEILIGIQIFSLKKLHLKMWSAKCHPFCLGLNVLRTYYHLWDSPQDIFRFATKKPLSSNTYNYENVCT